MSDYENPDYQAAQQDGSEVDNIAENGNFGYQNNEDPQAPNQFEQDVTEEPNEKQPKEKDQKEKQQRKTPYQQLKELLLQREDELAAEEEINQIQDKEVKRYERFLKKAAEPMAQNAKAIQELKQKISNQNDSSHPENMTNQTLIDDIIRMEDNNQQLEEMICGDTETEEEIEYLRSSISKLRQECDEYLLRKQQEKRRAKELGKPVSKSSRPSSRASPKKSPKRK